MNPKKHKFLITMTSLLEHSDAQVTEHIIFLPQKRFLKHYFYLTCGDLSSLNQKPPKSQKTV